MDVDQNKKNMIIRHNTKKRHLQIQTYDMNVPLSPSLAPQSHTRPAGLIILLVHLPNSQQQDLF